MTRKLITFLGKGRKEDGGYRQANYLFDEDNHNYQTPYFGFALLQELAMQRPIDHFMVFGTGESIWDALLSDDMEASDLWLKLGEQVESGTVTDSMLGKVVPEVENNLQKKGLINKLSLQLIPFGRDSCEQVAILQTLAGMINKGDVISMDITHGFRTLPMLGLISALFLQELKDVEVQGLFYGALEMTDRDGITPVVRLDGLMKIAGWLTAISAFKNSGNYGLFSDLLDNPDIADNLEQAGFLEQTLNVTSARSHLKKAMVDLPNLAAGDPVFQLFSPQLQEFMAWSNEQSYARRQIAAAKNALQTGNYVRAAALAMEAVITSMTTGNPQNYDERQKARDILNDSCRGKGKETPVIAAYMELRDLRNALAHGISPGRNSFNQQRTLKSRTELEKRLALLISDFNKTMS